MNESTAVWMPASEMGYAQRLALSVRGQPTQQNYQDLLELKLLNLAMSAPEEDLALLVEIFPPLEDQSREQIPSVLLNSQELQELMNKINWNQEKQGSLQEPPEDLLTQDLVSVVESFVV